MCEIDEIEFECKKGPHKDIMVRNYCEIAKKSPGKACYEHPKITVIYESRPCTKCLKQLLREEEEFQQLRSKLNEQAHYFWTQVQDTLNRRGNYTLEQVLKAQVWLEKCEGQIMWMGEGNNPRDRGVNPRATLKWCLEQHKTVVELYEQQKNGGLPRELGLLPVPE